MTMSDSNLKVPGHPRCVNLRWKGLYIGVDPDPSVGQGGDRHFWCQHTYICLGPDGKGVEEEDCNPSRSCYEAL